MSMHDLRQALRICVRNPMFALTVVLTLAIGVGAVTATFSLVNGILLRPLPYKEPDRLVVASSSFNEMPNESSYLDLMDWEQRNRVFEKMALMLVWEQLTITGGDLPERVDVSFVSAPYFDLLGVRAALGRTFLPEESATPGSAPVVVMSHDLWQNRFGSDPKTVGSIIRLNGQPYTVVGVLPEDYRDLSDGTKLWLPMTMVPVALNPDWMQNRNSRVFSALARLKPGVTVEQAQEDLAEIAKQLEAEYPETNQGYGTRVRSLFYFIFAEERRIQNVEQSMLTLTLASAFVLLISCVNVAILFLVHAANRRQEFGVRLALGARQSTLTWQLLAESLFLTFLGSALGTLLSYWAVRALLTLGQIDLPDFVSVGVDARVLGLAMLLSIITGLLFGLAPSRASARPDLRHSLQGSGKQKSSGERGFAWSFLIVSEVALAIFLLVGAGLMIRSFQRLHTTGIGFETDKLLTLRVTLAGPRYDDNAVRVQVAQSLADKVRNLPGVEVAGIWGGGTPGAGGGYVELMPEDRPAQRAEDMVRGVNHHIGPGSLTALGIRIIKGRDISPQDTANQPLVAVVSEALGQLLWPGQDPLGRRFVGGPYVFTVVGVAKNVQHEGRLAGGDTPELRDFYLSFAQRPVRSFGMFILTNSDPASLGRPVREVMKELDPELAVFDIMTAKERFAEEEGHTRLTTLLMGFYAAVAMLLASLGIWSVLTYSVSRRTNEIGVRMALGASHQDIYRMVLGQAMLLVVIGISVGIFGALALTRIMVSLLFGVSATDPRTFISVALGFILVALIASWWPARRAVSVQPVTALRYE